jgi:hypothetical protein
MQLAEVEATTGGEFDKLGLKRGMWDDWKAGKARLICKECPVGRVIAFVGGATAGQEPPWDLWGRIFQWFGAAHGGRPWRVFWFAAAPLRCFPGVGQDLGPEHVNGGYTQPCSTRGIFIYRKEEATRVLVHELMHAACLDESGWTIPEREAMVETWAELILVAIQSKGSVDAAAGLWRKQAQWVADSNRRASTQNGVEDITDYAWRYLNGRLHMYERLGVQLPPPRSTHESKSLRFTHPALGP